MTTKQQEKCNCECHKTSGSVCGICYGKRCSISVTNAPSPHQEGWRKDFDKKFVAITQGTKRCWWVDNPDRVIAYIEELLLSTHSADIAAFRGMIGKNEEDDSYLGETEHEEIHRKVRNAFRHELREKVKGGRYDHNY